MTKFIIIIGIAHLTFAINAQSNAVSSEINKIKGCQYTTRNRDDGLGKEEGCLVNNKKEGVWKEYTKAGWLRFTVPYTSDKREGSFKSFFENGKTNSIGFYKNDLLVDTFKVFNEKGDLDNISFWKIEGEKSVETYNKSFRTDIKSDGTIEEINGKKYVWVNGIKVEL